MIANKLYVLLILVVFSLKLCAQEEQAHHSKDQHGVAKEPGFESVVSGLIFYNPEFGLSDPATEIHLTYWTSHEWAFGIGYTLIYEDEGMVAHEIAGLVSHKPWPFLTLNIGPSFSLPNSHKNLEVSAYLETEVNFKIGKKGFHLGPVVGSLIGNELRLFAGIHLGYEF